MKHLIAICLAFTAGAAFANGHGNPGSHFIENWDLDGDGAVTLAEATERRGDIFLTFDADENGVLSTEEHDLFDEARANDMQEMGMLNSKNNPANGMLRSVTDANEDGEVSREEFMAAVPAWFARMDNNSDGKVTPEDFGKP